MGDGGARCVDCAFMIRSYGFYGCNVRFRPAAKQAAHGLLCELRKARFTNDSRITAPGLPRAGPRGARPRPGAYFSPARALCVRTVPRLHL